MSDLERMLGLLERLAHEFKGYLPHENCPGDFWSGNRYLSADTRTRLALIEDTLDKAYSILTASKAKV